VGVHFAGKHSLEFELFHFPLQAADIALDPFGGRGVGLRRRQFQQFGCVAKPARQAVQTAYDLFEFCALAAEFLRAFGVVPDAGLLEFASYFLEAFVLLIVIKDTPSRSRFAPRDLLWCA
jgi:hypothetical protein